MKLKRCCLVVLRRSYNRWGQRPMGKTKSQKCDGCRINSHFIGLGLLRTVFEIVVACREGPPPEFCCIAGDIEGGICENSFRPITFDWNVLWTWGQRLWAIFFFCWLVFGIWYLVFRYLVFGFAKLYQTLPRSVELCRVLQSSAKLGLKSAGGPCQRHRPRMPSLDTPTATRQHMSRIASVFLIFMKLYNSTWQTRKA